MQRIKSLFSDERGATMIEYGIIAALIAIVVVGGATLVGNATNDKFTAVSTQLSK